MNCFPYTTGACAIRLARVARATTVTGTGTGRVRRRPTRRASSPGSATRRGLPRHVPSTTMITAASTLTRPTRHSTSFTTRRTLAVAVRIPRSPVWRSRQRHSRVATMITRSSPGGTASSESSTGSTTVTLCSWTPRSETWNKSRPASMRRSIWSTTGTVTCSSPVTMGASGG